MEPVPSGSLASATSAPGTARFWTTSGGFDVRRLQETVSIRVVVSGPASGGGQPGIVSAGIPNGASAFPASSTGYAWRCCSLLIPSEM